MKQGNFIAMHLRQPFRTTGWCNFLDPKHAYMSCQISPNALAKIIVVWFFFLFSSEMLKYLFNIDPAFCNDISFMKFTLK